MWPRSRDLLSVAALIREAQAMVALTSTFINVGRVRTDPEIKTTRAFEIARSRRILERGVNSTDLLMAYGY